MMKDDTAHLNSLRVDHLRIDPDITLSRFSRLENCDAASGSIYGHISGFRGYAFQYRRFIIGRVLRRVAPLKLFADFRMTRFV